MAWRHTRILRRAWCLFRSVDVDRARGRSAGGHDSCGNARSLQREENIMGFIAWIVVGAIAGWLAGVLVKGGGFGLIVDIIVGIVGAFIGGWLFGMLGIHLGSGWIGSIITAVIGAVILLFVVRLIKRA
jgi:uncharacterized membrane protein YeaQ/YmgE (transglycosylase-associated protein family)